MKRIIHLDEVVLERHTHGDAFEALDGSVGEPIGARQLGCSLTVIPPGKRAYPFHNHHVNEEMFVILDGTGVVRIGANEYPIRAGDVIAAPAGDKDTAHQIVNTSSKDAIRFLSMSTKVPMDIVEYPDSAKVAVRVGGAPGDRSYDVVSHALSAVDYWEGE